MVVAVDVLLSHGLHLDGRVGAWPSSYSVLPLVSSTHCVVGVVGGGVMVVAVDVLTVSRTTRGWPCWAWTSSSSVFAPGQSDTLCGGFAGL